MLRLPNHNRLLRLLGYNLAIGVFAAALMTFGLVVMNVGGLKTLLASDPAGIVAVGLLFFGFAVTFGSVAMAIAVWANRDDDDDQHGGKRERVRHLRPSFATVRAR